MWVYLLRSHKNPIRKYVGLTANFEKRMAQHNNGQVTATYKFRPWRCVVRIWFEDSEQAGNSRNTSRAAADVLFHRSISSMKSIIRRSPGPQNNPPGCITSIGIS